jgi:hypothetical protein
MVASRGEFDAMMRSVQWDLVLVDVADSGSVITRAPNSNPPRILSIVYKPSKDELKAAKKQYWRILETPTKNQRFLEEIDWALAAKPPASPKARGSSGR